MIKSTPNTPTFLFDDLPLHWQMTRCEKYAFASLLEAAKPDVAIEIGTYQGGSLQMIARKAKKIYSLDISSNPQTLLAAQFPSVEFRVGDSKQLLPELLGQITEQKEPLGFILIDGDHSLEGVRADINSVLRNYIPIRPLYIVFHDSFHPPCRQGLLGADWMECKYVHYVEADFIPGVYHFDAFDTAEARSMYGGLAVALMLPEERTEELIIHQSQKGLFETIYLNSCHAPKEQLTAVNKPMVSAKPALLETVKIGIKKFTGK